jgi:hypothetical protein
VAAKILLEVQDAQVIRLAQRQQLAQSSISLDRLLIHQIVGLRIAHNTLRHGRAADLSALGVTQEGAQLIRHLHRLGEDAGLRLTALRLGGTLLLAIGLLGEASGLLLNRAQSIARSRGRGLQAGEVLLKRRNALLEGGTQILIRYMSDRLGRRGNRGRGRNRGDRDSLNSLGRLLRDLGGGNSRYRGRRLNLDRGGGGLLGGLGGRAHFVNVRGVNGRHLTRYTLSGNGAGYRVNFGAEHPQSCRPTLGRRASFIIMPKVGMNPICKSIRSKTHPGEQCSHRSLGVSEWCGVHGKQLHPQRFVEAEASAPSEDLIEHAPSVSLAKTRKDVECRETTADEKQTLALRAGRAWRRWMARRAGPLLHFRTESNNPFDFFSADPVEEIPQHDFISFVDAGKGYCMDIKSAVSLLEHATKSGETPINPFNRAPLPNLFKTRVARHGKTAHWESLAASATGGAGAGAGSGSAESLSITDTFRAMEDLGYYTDPQWFTDLSRLQLQRMYMELADIWYHRAGLSGADRNRIVPLPANAFATPVATLLVMQQRALRTVVLHTCRLLVSSAVARGDRQTGVMYVLGVLAMVSAGASAAYPWLVEMLSPGVTRIVGNTIQVLHPGVLAY